MNTHRSLILALIVSLSLLLPFTPTPDTHAQPLSPDRGAINPKSEIQNPKSISGWFLVLWDDPQPGEPASSGLAYLLRDDAGRSIRLFLSADLLRSQGGLLALDRRRVTVTGRWLSNQAIAVQSVQLDPAGSPTATGPDDIVGPQPWVSVLCKFADVPAEPEPQSYFEEMYGNSYPGLDHFWREVSYDIANVTGSAAVGWYVLPQPRSYYVYDQNGDGQPDLDWTRAANDCTAVADADIYYPDFVGINLMFNDLLDCCAWGGGWYTTLDGVSRLWYMTWEPPWGYGNVGVISHEMGHGFGLPHSSGNYGQTYDNQWDVMSDVWSNCAPDPTYGCLGQHTISFHKEMLGWVAPDLEFVAPTGTHATLILEQLALPQTHNYLLARIPVADSITHFYTVEARREVGYDVKLPGQAVIIHEVDTTRDRPARVIDIDGNGNTGDAGAMWIPGESFVDAAAGITVSVLSATPTGWVIGVENRVVSLVSLTLDGPAGCTVGAGCSLLATVTPVTASLPVTYVWEATGQSPVTHVSGLADQITYTWNVTGTQMITVTATNGCQPLVATYSLTSAFCLARIAAQPGITYTVVQAAVDAASPGDVVQVAGYCTGVSERAGLPQVVYLNKEITLRGGYNAADWSVCDPPAHPTTLDAQGLGRVVYVTGDAQSRPLLDSLTLTGGDAGDLGGGVYGRDAGGGLYAVTAAPTISGCHLYGNTAQEGGGAFLSSSPATFSHTTFSANSALSGGGLYLDHSTATLHANLFSANSATANGGGLFLRYSSAALSANRIKANTATTYGGGLYMTYSQPSLTNDVVAGNYSTYQGSGLYATYSSPQLRHTTIARNIGSNGCGLYATYTSSATLLNTIVAGQTTGIFLGTGCSANLDGVLWFDNQANTGGPGTIVVQHAVSGDPAFAGDGYHLTAGSAALDAGIDAGVTVDIDGDPRPLCFAHDLGADEMPPTLPAAALTSSSPDWLSQTTAFTNTTAAVCAAYLWDFGDGTSSAEANPVHPYTTPGLYTVTLTATAPGAGVDAASGSVTVYGPPAVAISAQPVHGLHPLLVTFAPATTTVPPGDPSLTYLWTFGDDLTSTLPAPTHTYTLPGLYTATLTVANPAGQSAAAAAILVADSKLYLPLVLRLTP